MDGGSQGKIIIFSEIFLAPQDLIERVSEELVEDCNYRVSTKSLSFTIIFVTLLCYHVNM